jgi:two-component system copper resistance phosphate regulon response regulator CusR
MQATMTEAAGVLSQFLPTWNRDFPRIFHEAEGRPQAHSYRVLIMERNPSLAKLLATGLAAENLLVDVTHDPDEMALQLAARSYNLVILDMDAPDSDSTLLLQTLRAEKLDTRVLALSGRNDIHGLVKALDHGADDYLFKPFSLLELLARVRALRRRSDSPVPGKPQASRLILHRDQCRVERDGKNIDLTPREFALLEVMVENAGKTLSRATLTQQVWNMQAEANTNIVDVYVKYLRDKIDGDHDEKLIRTVRGMGYVLRMA